MRTGLPVAYPGPKALKLPVAALGSTRSGEANPSGEWPSPVDEFYILMRTRLTVAVTHTFVRARLSLIAFAIQASGLAPCSWHSSHPKPCDPGSGVGVAEVESLFLIDKSKSLSPYIGHSLLIKAG
jgi:hypothetical protein